MDGDLDPFDFELCEALGWPSLAAMYAGLGHGEYLMWRAFNVWRNARRELAMASAGSDGNG